MEDLKTFDRWSSLDPNTLAFRVFKKHHSEINDFIWSFVPLYNYGSHIVRKDLSNKNIHELFHVSGTNARRVYEDRNTWKKQISNFEKWTNVNALISILSYFEVYLKRICTTALLSDPGVLISASRSVDGIKLIKNKSNPKSSDHILQILKGTWPDRAKNFKNLFSEIPSEISENLLTLDKMRMIRNRAAHSFGRLTDKNIFVERSEDKAHDRVKLNELQEYMSIIEKVAIAIDRQLLKNNIGEFESLFLLHNNFSEFTGFNDTKARSFSHFLNKDYVGNTRSRRFCLELVNHYCSS